MIDEKSYDAFALQLFGLENIDVQSIKVLRSGNDISIDIFLVPKPTLVLIAVSSIRMSKIMF